MTALERAQEMMTTPMGQLPIMAVLYARKLLSEVGVCGEVYLTAYAAYAQCVEGLACDDDLYKAQDPEFFKQTQYLGIDIRDLCERAWATAEAKGFHEPSDADYGFAARAMDIVGHLAEAVEHDRADDDNGMLGSLYLVSGDADSLARYPSRNYVKGDSFRGRMMLAVTEIVEAVAGYARGDITNVAEELADLMIRVADTAKQEGIDLEKAIRTKMVQNENRPPMHGGKKY